jgi:hypothetical protein
MHKQSQVWQMINRVRVQRKTHSFSTFILNAFRNFRTLHELLPSKVCEPGLGEKKRQAASITTGEQQTMDLDSDFRFFYRRHVFRHVFATIG